MSSTPAELATQIQEATTVLTEYLKQNNLPQPSLDVNGAGLPRQISDKKVSDARTNLLSATRSLQSIIAGPMGVLLATGANDILCLQIILRYRVQMAFSLDEQVTFEELSSRVHLNVRDLRRIVRYAITNNIFSEPRPDIVAHSAVSKVLREDPVVRDFVGNVCEVRFPASSRVADALEKYDQSANPAQSGFGLFFNTSRGVYDELPHYPEKQQRWDNAMKALAGQINFDFILNSFPWSQFANGKVVDVGGGSGSVSIGLADRLPSANFIVQDNSESACVEGSQAVTSYNGRIKFEQYDFRHIQPVKGADVYYFRNIFHNWPDQSCIEILKNHVPALKKGARFCIDDFALHEPLTLAPFEERRRRWMDINMLIFFGSRERSLREWEEMLKKADPRYKLVKATQAEDQPSTILDVEWTGD